MSTEASAPRGLIRQGDLLLVPTDVEVVDGGPPASRRAVERLDGRLVLAEGEATGHAHAILDGHARLERQGFGVLRRAVRDSWSGWRTVLIVEGSSATLLHEEHDPLTVPTGGYLVRRQREYVPAAGWRRVAD